MEETSTVNVSAVVDGNNDNSDSKTPLQNQIITSPLNHNSTQQQSKKNFVNEPENMTTTTTNNTNTNDVIDKRNPNYTGSRLSLSVDTATLVQTPHNNVNTLPPKHSHSLSKRIEQLRKVKQFQASRTTPAPSPDPDPENETKTESDQNHHLLEQSSHEVQQKQKHKTIKEEEEEKSDHDNDYHLLETPTRKKSNNNDTTQVTLPNEKNLDSDLSPLSSPVGKIFEEKNEEYALLNSNDKQQRLIPYQSQTPQRPPTVSYSLDPDYSPPLPPNSRSLSPLSLGSFDNPPVHQHPPPPPPNSRSLSPLSLGSSDTPPIHHHHPPPPPASINNNSQGLPQAHYHTSPEQDRSVLSTKKSMSDSTPPRPQSSSRNSYYDSNNNSNAEFKKNIQPPPPRNHLLVPVISTKNKNINNSERTMIRENLIPTSTESRSQQERNKNNTPQYQNNNNNNNNISTLIGRTMSNSTEGTNISKDWDADLEWTPQDSGYGAACPVCGCVPKSIRKAIEFSIVYGLVVAVFIFLIRTSFHLSVENKEETVMHDDDFYYYYDTSGSSLDDTVIDSSYYNMADDSHSDDYFVDDHGTY